MNLDVPFHDWPTQRRFILGSLRRGRDAWIGFEGPEGSGKTTNAANVVADLNPQFSLEQDAIFNVEQLLEALDRGKKRTVYFLDEAANIFYNRDWNTWESKELTRIGRQMRIMESLWCVIMPDLDSLDPYLREERLLMRCYQPPYYDQDGISNGPSKMMFRTEYFDYKEQKRKKRWVDVYDFHAQALQSTTSDSLYNRRKEDNFKQLVKHARQRLVSEQEAEQRKATRERNKDKKPTKNSPKPKSPKPPGKKTVGRASPPTTT